MNAANTHPLLTDDALHSLSGRARKMISDASGLLISLHGRAERRFSDASTKEATEAIAELNVLANYLVAVLARFDRAESNLFTAMSQDI